MRTPSFNPLGKLMGIKEALLNVPEVGEVYDQQHSDTHMAATLLLEEVKADINRLATSLKQVVDVFEPRDPSRKEAIVWDRANALVCKLEGGAK